ncbi:MAG: sigma-70 family RNA polymerase sigma factor [Chloroflexi bacterium]|nr:MAG: sigma-70 family RNA polymerase sigma factor [Chloroflexota bacterium]
MIRTQPSSSGTPPKSDPTRDEFERLLSELRPGLHRYCARMTGSAVDGEDIVQEAMIKAFVALPAVGVVDNPEGWVFRIAHNTALDFLRRRARGPVIQHEEALDMVPAPDSFDQSYEVATASLRTFMRLPALQRSAVILKDVLGHSVEEIASVTGASEPAAKSALQRGRARLRAFAREPEDIALPMLSDAMRVRLTAYVDGFRAGDFDAVRAMLADDVTLDLVAKFRKQGRSEVGEYYSRYAASEQWTFAPAIVDGRTAMLVYDREISLETPAYFVALDIERDRVVAIHDFLFARYAMDGIALHRLNHPHLRSA